MKKELSLFALLFACQMAASQSVSIISFDIEAGFNTVGCDNTSLSRLRSNAADDDYYYDWGYDSRLTNWYVGIKPEVALCNKVSVDAGLRFTYTTSNYDRDHSRYFYWLYKEDGQYTSYIRLRKIEQESYWLGIPFDIRFVPRDLDRTSIYLKAGLAANWRLKTRNDIDTYNRDMKRYEDDIAEQIENPNNFALPIWLGVGIQFGSHHAACIELTLPYWLKHAKMSSLCKANHTAIGLQFTYRLPNWSNND